ncbi:hypothetical protein HT031_001895 [Scenedesmus sp. PABB004]|nr:hypothetical protein HT031_001895 [Scenedesmus sp. PABB004]
MQALVRAQALLPAAALPRELTGLSASSSSCTPCRHSGCPAGPARLAALRAPQLLRGAGGRAARGVARRVTGRREEYALEGIVDPELVWGEDADQEFIEVDNTPMWAPERGGVGDRVFREAEDEQGTKSISIEDTAYWFADSGGVDLPRSVMMRAMPETDVTTIDECLPCEDIEGLPPRLKLSELEEGDELTGVVTDLWLWHGALVDVLAEFKGLIAIRQGEWEDVEVELLPGAEVVARVHKLPEWPKYRFPIQLELLEPAELRGRIMAPTDYVIPANVGWAFDQGWDIHKVARELGREYHDTVALLEPDHAEWTDDMQYAFGHDAADAATYPGDWLSREVLDDPGMIGAIQEMAEDDAQALAGSGGDAGGGGWGI